MNIEQNVANEKTNQPRGKPPDRNAVARYFEFKKYRANFHKFFNH